MGIKKEFSDEEQAERHEIYDHDLLYLPIEKKDLNGLLNFIVSNENNKMLISPQLWDTLFYYTRVNR